MMKVMLSKEMFRRFRSASYVLVPLATLLVSPLSVSADSTATISATSIVCNSESDLPNWGDHSGPAITSTTASDYLASHPNCHRATGWNFQYALGDVYNYLTDYPQGNIAVAPSPWVAFGSTDSNGVASVQIPTIPVSGGYVDWLRLMPQAGYVPFSDPSTGGNTNNNYSSEFYCDHDHFFYDNFEAVVPTALLPGNTYYCIAFNSPVSSNNFTVRATGIECDTEAYLPNRAGGAAITSTTATEFMAAGTNSAHCHYQSNLGIEWGDGYNAVMPGGWNTNWHIITGPLGAAYGWYTLGYTDASGVVTNTFPYNPATMASGGVPMREMLPVQDIPFYGETNDSSHPSAEFYCGKDVTAYDNYENGVQNWVPANPTSGSFDCVAWNAPSKHTLTVSISGSGPISSGSGINCPGNCSQSYSNGSTVILIATPSAGYAFSSWSGACAGQGSTCSVVMDADKTAQANFVPSTGSNCTTLSVSSMDINTGSPVTLTWVCDSSCTAISNADGFSTSGNSSGSDVANPSIPSGSVTYGMTCGGATVYFPTVTVHSPNVTLLASPARIQSGGSTTVSWSTNGTTSCVVKKNGGNWKTGTTNSGISETGITTQTVYSITCHTGTTDISATTTVNIGPSYQQF
jgi:hypothetical protein